jgi:hypothetical protein
MHDRGRWRVAALIVGTALVLIGPLAIDKRWPVTHEQTRYALLLDQFRAEQAAGHWYPRWLPNAYGGHGYPTFVFYQPGYFFLTSALSWLPDAPWSAMWTATLILLVAGGTGAYLLCREVADRATAGFGAVLFLLTPYLFVNFHVRGDLSEMMAMLLCPWPFWFLARLERARDDARWRAACVAGIAVGLALVVISHPLTAMFLFPAFCLIALGTGWGLEVPWRWRYGATAAAGVVLAVGLAAPYWMPVIQMKPAVRLDAAFEGYYHTVHHLVWPWQLFSNMWGMGGSNAGDLQDGMSFQLGLPHFLLATLGALACVGRRLVRTAYVVYLGLLVLMTPAAWAIWNTVEALRPVQFPWRILSVTACLQVMAVAGIGRIPGIPPAQRRYVLGVLLFATVLWYAPMFQVGSYLKVNRALRHHVREQLSRVTSYSEANEFLPRTARAELLTEARGSRPLVEPEGGEPALPLPGNAPGRIRYHVASGPACFARIHQLHFPGWRVEVDGQVVPERTLGRLRLEDGRMRIPLRPGQPHVVTARYEGPPGWRLRTALAVSSLAVLVGLQLLARRPRSPRRPALLALPGTHMATTRRPQPHHAARFSIGLRRSG